MIVFALDLNALEKLMRDNFGTIDGAKGTETHFVNQIISSSILEHRFDFD